LKRRFLNLFSQSPFRNDIDLAVQFFFQKLAKSDKVKKISPSFEIDKNINITPGNLTVLNS